MRKLLLISDAPEGSTGLGRITRELCWQMWSDDDFREQFEPMTLGYNANGSLALPWKQFATGNAEPSQQWLRVLNQLQENDVVTSITPPGWIFGLANPEWLTREDPKLGGFSKVMERLNFWPYLAIESLGKDKRYGTATMLTLNRLKTGIFYSAFGYDAAPPEIQQKMNWIHHGVNTERFFPTPRRSNKVPIIGCVMTNTYRKRFGLLFEALHSLRAQDFNFQLYIHTSKVIADWNLCQLAEDYDIPIGQITFSSTLRDDEWMRNFYSQCDCTVLPSYGEGFGYPVIESQLCGTPCVVGEWGAQRELIPTSAKNCVVPYMHLQMAGSGLIEPIYHPDEFAASIYWAITNRSQLTEEIADFAKNWSWNLQWLKFRDFYLS